MSVLLYIDQDDNDMVELKCGQYRYNVDDGSIVDVSSNMKVYVNRVPLTLTSTWINRFILSPSTKVTLYAIDQSDEHDRYTGDMLMVYNYNSNKSDSVYVDLEEYTEGLNMLDNVRYIVISSLDKCRNRHKTKKGKQMFMMRYYDSDVHTRRLREEADIIDHKGILSTYNFNDVLIVVIVLVIVFIVFYIAFTVATIKSKHIDNYFMSVNE